MKRKLQAAQSWRALGVGVGGELGEWGCDLHWSLSGPLVLSEANPSNFLNSSGGLSRSAAVTSLCPMRCSVVELCGLVRDSEQTKPAGHRFEALQPLGDDVRLSKRLIIYFFPRSFDIIHCTKAHHEFAEWKDSHSGRRKTQLHHDDCLQGRCAICQDARCWLRSSGHNDLVLTCKAF